MYLNYLVSTYKCLLEIEKINLIEVISEEENLNHGLKYAHFNDEVNDPIVIMGHSGLGENALFNDLISLEIEDKISLHFLKEEQIYKVTNKIKFQKFSSINIKKDKDYLYLVTCDLKDYTKQWLIEAKIT